MADEQPPPSLWLVRGRTFVGGVVVGLGVNAVSDAYPGAAAVAVGAAVLLVALAGVELRRFPAQAPLQRLVSWVCLGGAGVAALLSVLAPSPWRAWAVLGAAALAVISYVAPTPGTDIPGQLQVVAMIGLGVAVIGGGVSRLLDSQLLVGVAVIGVGVALIGGGVSSLLDSELLFGVAEIGLGVAAIGFGVSSLLDSELLLGVAVIGVGAAVLSGGVAVIGFGVFLLLDSQLLLGVAVIGVGMAVIGGGVSLLLDSQLLFGVAVIGVGAALIGGRVALIARRRQWDGHPR